MLPASRIEATMGKRARISATIRGLVLKVTQSRGGWFDIDAGKGKIIKAHFKKNQGKWHDFYYFYSSFLRV